MMTTSSMITIIFKKKIRRVYDIFNEKQAVEKKIQYITQVKSTVDYVNKFTKHVNFIEWNDAVKMIIFKQKFKSYLKKKSIRLKIWQKQISK